MHLSKLFLPFKLVDDELSAIIENLRQCTVAWFFIKNWNINNKEEFVGTLIDLYISCILRYKIPIWCPWNKLSTVARTVISVNIFCSYCKIADIELLKGAKFSSLLWELK